MTSPPFPYFLPTNKPCIMINPIYSPAPNRYDSGMNYRYAAEDTPGAGTSVQAALVNVSASVTMTFEAK